MKTLPTEFNKNTYQYKQVWRDEDYAIYEQSDNGKFVAYEVFRINKNEAGERFGRLMEASESVPTSNEWGKTAYTTYTHREMPFLHSPYASKFADK